MSVGKGSINRAVKTSVVPKQEKISATEEKKSVKTVEKKAPAKKATTKKITKAAETKAVEKKTVVKKTTEKTLNATIYEVGQELPIYLL